MSNLNVNEEDQQSLAAFRKSYPIGFSLHDDNGEHCLYITDDANGQKLHLELSNTSQQNIELAKLNSGEATSDNHHVELRFRPGTLHLASLAQIVLVEDNWKLNYKKQTDRTVSLYFLYTDTLAEKTLKPSEKINLTLLKVRAAADGGARVSQVELKYQNLRYQNETTDPIRGSRVQRLSVVNHLGQQNIPLHVGFVGSNAILNDGESPSKLILRITNVLKKDRIPLNLPSSGNNASKFIIYFDIPSEHKSSKDWALGTKSEVEHISIEGKDWKLNEAKEADWKVDKETEGELPRWVLTHQNETEPGLDPGEVVQLTIENIKTSLPSGHTNLYLRYENIPGYWDGEFVCTIEKTPLLYFKEKNSGEEHIALMASGNVYLKGDFCIKTQEKNQKPFVYEIYDINNNEPIKKTEYKVKEWTAIAAGYSLLVVKDGIWCIDVNFKNIKDDSGKIAILFIRNEMVELKSLYVEDDRLVETRRKLTDLKNELINLDKNLTKKQREIGNKNNFMIRNGENEKIRKDIDSLVNEERKLLLSKNNKREEIKTKEREIKELEYRIIKELDWFNGQTLF